MLTRNENIQQQRRAALAHQCRSCRRHWALGLERGANGWLILCRYCGAPRAAQPPEQTPTAATADVPGKAKT